MKKTVEFFIWALKSEKRISFNTQKAYLQDLNCFLSFLNNMENFETILEDYFVYLKKFKFASSTISRRMITVIQFLNFCKKENLYNINLNDKPKIIVEKIYSIFLTTQDQEKLILSLNQDLGDNFHNSRLLFIIETLYSTGLRVSELLNLKMHDVDDIFNQKSLIIVGKGGAKRIVFFNEASINALKKYLRVKVSTGEYILNSGKTHLSRQRIFQMLKDLALKANVDPCVVFPHSFRHRLLTDLVKKGADLVSVQKIAGHKQISTTEKYTHVEDYLYDEIKKYHPLCKYRFKDCV